MNRASDDTKSAVLAASITAAAMIAYQVGAKATRDALFLSSLGIRALPAMMVASAAVAILLAYVSTRALVRWGPGRIVPTAFAASSLLLLIEWGLSGPYRKLAAVLVYLHYGGLGALLVSGFWSFVGERFDPRTARRHLGRVAAGGTLGGLFGGLVASQVGRWLPVTAMLPILAAFHAASAALSIRLRPSAPEAAPASKSNPEKPVGVRRLLGAPYLKTLIALVFLATVAEGLIDLVLKGRASLAFATDRDLLQFFGVFYTGISLLTFVAQATVSRLALNRLGPARAAALLPAGAATAAIGAIAAPGLAAAALARGVESVLHNSLFQTGYEVLFTPVPAREKRAVKTLVDVGGTRVGDMVAAGLAQGALALALPAPGIALLALSVAASAASLAAALALHAGYVRTLGRALLERAVQLDISDAQDSITRSTILRTVVAPRLPRLDMEARTEGETVPPGDVRAQAPSPSDGGPDDAAEVARTQDLRSRDPLRVIRALRSRPFPPSLALRTIPLLAWDEVVHEAIDALRHAGPDAVEPLVARLLDQEEEFTIRRRIPLVLATYRDRRAVDALAGGLADRRFEVRYRCGRGLSHLLDLDPSFRVAPEQVYEAVGREAEAGAAVWRGRQVLDDMDDAAWSPVLDQAIRTRASRSLEHVFTLLALVLPRRPLRIAFRGLHTGDPLLRGTALEYLESVLPPEIRKQLWPYLEDDRPRRPAAVRPAEEALANLLQSGQSIALKLSQLKQDTPARDEETRPPGGDAPPGS